MSTNFVYISPSSIPSSSANSVHVIMQCAALVNENVKLKIYANRTIKDPSKLLNSLSVNYGVNLENAKVITFFTNFKFCINLRIALIALFYQLFSPRGCIVLSRNLYFSFFYAVFLGRPLLFETHQVECGFRKLLQRWTMIQSWVKTIVISKKLEEILTEEHCVAPYNSSVLPDAATSGLVMSHKHKRRGLLFQITKIQTIKWSSICGYFGQLYEGRGVEIIESMAKARPNILFLVYGGEPDDVIFRSQRNNKLQNIFFGGHIKHPKAQELMRCVDCLLMPYQLSVSIGGKGHDTGRWMSPMKMFEYMATGVPIISSDIPVLREVLRNGENAILVPHDDTLEWCNALDRLNENSNLADNIGRQAYYDYKKKYTWKVRAKKILSLHE